MTERIQDILKKVAFFSLTGYFLCSLFSLFLMQIFLVISLLAVLVVWFGSHEYRRWKGIDAIYILIVLFAGWCCLAALVSPTPLKSLGQLKEEWLFLMIPVAAYLLDDERKIKTVLTALTISAVIVSIYAILQHFAGFDFYHRERLEFAPHSGYRAIGVFSTIMTFGNCMATATILLLCLAAYSDKGSRKVLFYLSFFFGTLAVLFTYGRGPIAVLIAGVILFIIYYGRKSLRFILPLLLILAAIIMVFSPDIFIRYSSSSQMEIEGKYAGARLSIWGTTLRMIEDYPVFGVGQGNFQELYPLYRDKDSDRVYGHAHNDLLNIAAYAGIPAMIFYLGFWIAMMRKIWRVLKGLKENGFIGGVLLGGFLASIVFFLTSLYEATFADEEVRLFLMAVWGLSLGAIGVVKSGGEMVEKIEKT